MFYHIGQRYFIKKLSQIQQRLPADARQRFPFHHDTTPGIQHPGRQLMKARIVIACQTAPHDAHVAPLQFGDNRDLFPMPRMPWIAYLPRSGFLNIVERFCTMNIGRT